MPPHHFFHPARHQQHRGHHAQHVWPGHSPSAEDPEAADNRPARGPFRSAGGRHGGARDGDSFDHPNERRGGGRRGGGGSRMFGHGDLKLLLLALIEQQPRHGYELIRLIEDMFHGHYTPSPGAIYPTLTMLEELGHAEIVSQQGGRKLYAVTAAGRTYLDENRPAVEAMSARTEHSARMAAKMAMPAALREAMQSLKRELLGHGPEWDKAEMQRVAAILERAAAEIAARPQDG